jgi:PilZ domain-containing protein
MPSPRTRKVLPPSRSRQDDSGPTAERRIQPRFTTQLRSTFSAKHQEGQGRTLDVSLGGCKVESDMRVAPGQTLECRLHVPGFDWPLRIDEAIVRWVQGSTFGLGFTRMRPEEEAKLEIVVDNLLQGS